MSAPTGIDPLSIQPKPTKNQNRAAITSVLPQPAKISSGIKPKPSPRFGGAADTLLGSLTAPKFLQESLLYTAKEGANAVLPLEAAVVAGRTHSAYRRDGWMEVQERVFEELAAAAIWLKGVDFLKERFKSGQNRFLPQFKHLSPDIAWNRPWGKAQTVDLTAQELFAKDGREINSLLRLKSARWLFSVGLALTGVAYVVPTLNQLKTKALMSYQMSRRKRSQEGDNVQFGDPRWATTSTVPLSGTPASTPSTHGAFGQQLTGSSNSPIRFNPVSNQSLIQSPSSQSPSGSPAFQPYQAGSAYANSFPRVALGSSVNQTQPNAPLRFGGFSGGSSLTQGLGHLVDQTPYGSILVVDAGIAGGRGYVASKRSSFETVEVLVRDIGSLYFYILSVPHIMKGLGMAADGLFKTSSGLEPKIAALLDEKLQKHSTLDAVKAALHGDPDPGLMLPESWLKNQMRTADAEKVANRLALEAQVYLGGNQAAAFVEQVRNTSNIMPKTIQGWLEEISTGKGLFKTWEALDRNNLSIALKQAFRHTVGIEAEAMTGPNGLLTQLEKQCPDFGEALKSLPPKAREAFGKRVQRMGQVDALDQAHSLFRRSINVMRDKLKDYDYTQAEALTDWLDNAKSRSLPLSKLAELESKNPLHQEGPQKLRALMGDFLSLTRKHNLTKEERLLSAYQAQLEQLFKPDAVRLFSLATDEGMNGLNLKLREMLQGGLHNDTAFLREAQMILGQFQPDSRLFADPARALKMRETIGKYGDALLHHLSGLGENVSPAKLKAGLKHFLNLNRNLNYASRSVALLGTMACLGWLVPHVQTTITKRLTGQDKNPGIASTFDALGYGRERHKQPKTERTQTQEPSSAQPSNGIFVGQTTLPRYYPRVGQTAYQS